MLLMETATSSISCWSSRRDLVSVCGLKSVNQRCLVGESPQLRQGSSTRPRRDHAGHHFPKHERQSNRALAEHAPPAGPVVDSVRSSQPNTAHSNLEPACPSSLTTYARAKNHRRRRPRHGVSRSPSRDGRSAREDASGTELRQPKEPFARGSPEWYSDDGCWPRLGSSPRCEDGSSHTGERTQRSSSPASAGCVRFHPDS